MQTTEIHTLIFIHLVSQYPDLNISRCTSATSRSDVTPILSVEHFVTPGIAAGLIFVDVVHLSLSVGKQLLGTFWQNFPFCCLSNAVSRLVGTEIPSYSQHCRWNHYLEHEKKNAIVLHLGVRDGLIRDFGLFHFYRNNLISEILAIYVAFGSDTLLPQYPNWLFASERSPLLHIYFHLKINLAA